MKRKLQFLFAPLIFMLTGCPSSMSNMKEFKKPLMGLPAMESQAAEELSKTPSLVQVKLRSDELTVAEAKTELPKQYNIAIRDVHFTNVDLDKILFAISQSAGVNLMYQYDKEEERGDTSTPSSSTSSNKKTGTTSSTDKKREAISITFTGDLNDMLKALSNISGVFFTYENNTLIVKDRNTFSIAIPHYPGIKEEIENTLKTLGASDISFDKFTSTVSFKSDWNSLQRIKAFCSKMRDNASLVTMRVMLMNVKVSKAQSRGIDWTKFVLGLQHQKQPNFGMNANTSDSSSGSSTSSTATATLSNNNFGVATVMGATGAQVLVENASFTLSALINFIDTYGRYEVKQDAFVEALSGTKAHLDSLTETPYVSEVSFSALSAQSSTATQAVKTDKAKSGVEMDISPSYNREDGTLEIALKVSVLGVTRYLSLDAGQQIGKITQPETTRKNMDTYLRMVPSQVAIIGGLVLESKSNSASGLPGDTPLSKAMDNNTEREELVIVVKPTIIEFVK